MPSLHDTRAEGEPAALKAIVERGKISATITKSELEARFLSFLDTHDLPRPLINHRIGPYEIDATWPAQRLIVELDGREAHATISAFERDRARDRHLQVDGYRVIPITYRQLQDDADRIATQLGTLLADRLSAP